MGCIIVRGVSRRSSLNLTTSIRPSQHCPRVRYLLLPKAAGGYVVWRLAIMLSVLRETAKPFGHSIGATCSNSAALRSLWSVASREASLEQPARLHVPLSRQSMVIFLSLEGEGEEEHVHASAALEFNHHSSRAQRC